VSAWVGLAAWAVASVTISARPVQSVQPAQSAQSVVDRVVAIVGEQVITLSDVRAAQALGLVEGPAGLTREQLVTRLIERELMRAEVERFGAAEIAPAVIDARVQVVRSRFPSAAAFAAALDVHGLSDARFRAWLLDDARIEQYVQQRFGAAAQPTDEEVQQYYLSREREFADVEGRPRPFADVADEVRQRLVASRRQTMVEDWIAGLRRRSTVVVKDQGLDPR
jgi:tRNA isopentenyl-2-thiomethyl-A-37 hydroxylase MiaE